MLIEAPKTLDQVKLDVAKKVRSNIFNWRGQFTPQFVEYLLDTFAAATDLTFDPFCGSGTVLLESARRNINSTGYEINPAAYAMAKFITLSTLPSVERHDILRLLKCRIDKLFPNYHDLPLFQPKPAFRDKYKNLLEFAGDLFTAVEGKKELLLALILIFHAQRNGKSGLVPSIAKAYEIVRNKLLSLPYTSAKLSADLYDARLSYQNLSGMVDLIITSPPYINVFNYHQNYRAILEVMGFDLLKVAASEIGSNRKNRMNRFRTVVQYALDMEQALVSFARTLKKNGLLILVVGRESRVRRVPFSNSGLLKELAKALGCYWQESENERIFTNRFGQSIREDILVLRNTGENPFSGSARAIAEDFLRHSLGIATGTPREDIIEVLSTIASIKPSPLFDRKGII